MLQLVFVDLLHKKLYVTEDEGNSFAEYPAPFSPDHLLFHPSEPKLILAYTKSDRTVSYLLLHPHAVLELIVIIITTGVTLHVS